MGIKHVEASGNSLLVVQEIASTFQCFDASLNAYLNKCLKIISLFDDFTVHHISRDENIVANELVQQASGFRSNRGKFGFMEKLDGPVYRTGCFGFQPMYSVTICYVEPSLAKPDGPVSKIGGSKIFRICDKSSKTMTTNPSDWRTPLVLYLENPGHIDDRKVQRQALKYVMLYNTLYHQTIDGLLLKCLGSNQSKIAMGGGGS
jgi:hypothetical protein